MKILLKLLLIFVPATLLITSFVKSKISTENCQKNSAVMMHNWRIFLNDSMVFSTIAYDYPKELRHNPIPRSFLFSIYDSEIQKTDSIQIKYYSDAFCGNELPLIHILNHEYEVIKRIESHDKFCIYTLNKEFPNDSLFRIRYTDSECPKLNEPVVWDDIHMASVMSIQIKRLPTSR